MKVLITGADGFIGKNLVLHLAERKDAEVLPFTRETGREALGKLVAQADFIFHLAGINRPQQPEEFQDNADLTVLLCEAVAASGRKIPVLYSSSIQAELDNPYGQSKRAAEDALLSLQKLHGVSVFLYRLPNVFGKWARPNYNSVVATFCHNIARGLPIRINDESTKVTLVYVDDVISSFLDALDGNLTTTPFVDVAPQYTVTVGELAKQIHAFRSTRENMVTESVGVGFVRALHSTYVSYLPPEDFSYSVQRHADPRGVFVEMLKTKDSGQFSFFTAHPGITRGGHYHHSKTERFLVIKGKACFRFRHMVTGEFHEIFVDGDESIVVETVPGWTHDITNVGDDEMIVMLWANEIFDRQNSDTFACPVGVTP